MVKSPFTDWGDLEEILFSQLSEEYVIPAWRLIESEDTEIWGGYGAKRDLKGKLAKKFPKAILDYYIQSKKATFTNTTNREDELTIAQTYSLSLRQYLYYHISYGIPAIDEEKSFQHMNIFALLAVYTWLLSSYLFIPLFYLINKLTGGKILGRSIEKVPLKDWDYRCVGILFVVLPYKFSWWEWIILPFDFVISAFDSYRMFAAMYALSSSDARQAIIDDILNAKNITRALAAYRPVVWAAGRAELEDAVIHIYEDTWSWWAARTSP